MKKIITLIVLLALMSITVALNSGGGFQSLEAEISCRENEKYTNCGSACPDTCDNYKDQQRMCTYQCFIGCQCDKGYVRNSNGKCVHPEDCPRKSRKALNLLQETRLEIEPNCKENEKYTNCGTACPDTCDNYLDRDQVCTFQCVLGCECKPGYVRHPNGKCVHPDECPVKSQKLSTLDVLSTIGDISLEKETTCKKNEQYTDCGTACPDTCDNYLDKDRVCTLQCVIGCECKDGYVRNSNGKCVHPDKCHVKSRKRYQFRGIGLESEVSCKKNEEYTSCGTACPDTCDNYKDQGQMCTLQCVVGCQCKKGYVRNSNGECVHPDECSVKSLLLAAFRSISCKENEKYTECGSACADTCDNYKDGGRVCAAMCVVGCQCENGYVRNSNGECVQPDECP